MSEKNKCAPPSGAKEQIGQNGAYRAITTLKGARWECALIFFAHSKEYTILHNISQNERNRTVASQVTIFFWPGHPTTDGEKH